MRQGGRAHGRAPSFFFVARAQGTLPPLPLSLQTSGATKYTLVYLRALLASPWPGPSPRTRTEKAKKKTMRSAQF